ncbi:MAG: hypothetical protein K0S29_334 [Gammaproteobacteria bacterium]|jgi:ectoine hydroxylase-related dioxygenase (phytanoyl-CoA dioxygenase family)|nr:hypothetical protein [Gammaproteobacteria bacterium]
MSNNSYGQLTQTKIADSIQYHVEQITILGYSIVRGVLSEEEISLVKEKVYTIYQQQVSEFQSEEVLDQIHEKDFVRGVLEYDSYFIKIAAKETVLAIVKNMLGDKIVLQSQNAIINKPFLQHRHGAWHRDLPYQNFIISKPLAITALFAIDTFSHETGGTVLVPCTHKLMHLPSEEFIKEHSVQINANAGDVVLFDSMLMHRAGNNIAGKDRIAVNHVYTVPILKQQIDLPSSLGDEYNTPELADLLGYSTQVAKSSTEWRQMKLDKLKPIK